VTSKTRGFSYSIDEHRHRFAVWTAAAAVRRGFSGTTPDRVSRAIEASGLRLVAFADPSVWPTDTRQLDMLHENWAHSIRASLEAEGVSCSYGRAAKMIAVYLKATVILRVPISQEFAKLIHPPIDRALLQALSSDSKFAADDRELWRRTAWTTLDEDQYFRLIETFRVNGRDRPGFWQVERYWRPEIKDVEVDTRGLD
jgi:hypothetical protein